MTVPPEGSTPGAVTQAAGDSAAGSVTAPATAINCESQPSPGRDAEQLKILAVFWYVVAVLLGLGGCGGLVYIVIGILAFAGLFKPDNVSPQAMGTFFLVMGVLLAAVCLVFAGLSFLCARFLGQQRRRTFCFVMAAILCLSFPLGTALGVFTLLVLARPSVKASFA